MEKNHMQTMLFYILIRASRNPSTCSWNQCFLFSDSPVLGLNLQQVPSSLCVPSCSDSSSSPGFSPRVSAGCGPSWASTRATCCAWAWAWPAWCACACGAASGEAASPGTARRCSSTGTRCWWSRAWLCCTAMVGASFGRSGCETVSFVFLASVFLCVTVVLYQDN